VTPSKTAHRRAFQEARKSGARWRRWIDRQVLMGRPRRDCSLVTTKTEAHSNLQNRPRAGMVWDITRYR
jgi:hypothetical protein